MAVDHQHFQQEDINNGCNMDVTWYHSGIFSLASLGALGRSGSSSEVRAVVPSSPSWPLSGGRSAVDGCPCWWAGPWGLALQKDDGLGEQNTNCLKPWPGTAQNNHCNYCLLQRHRSAATSTMFKVMSMPRFLVWSCRILWWSSHDCSFWSSKNHVFFKGHTPLRLLLLLRSGANAATAGACLGPGKGQVADWWGSSGDEHLVG